MNNSLPRNPVSAYRPDIDGLRAIAVLAVVTFHAFPEQLTGGFIGVDIFFVISGFLISTIIFREIDSAKFSLIDFYKRRIKRILPALILVLIACYGIGWFTLIGDDYKQLGKHIAAAAGFISNLALWQESGYFDADADSKILIHLWSLGVEEQFYLVWPLLLWLLRRTGVNLLLAMLSLALASFYLNIRLTDTNAAAAFYLPHTRFWELSLGSVLAWMKLRRSHRLDASACATSNAGSTEPRSGRRWRYPGKNRGPLLCNAAALIGALLLGLGLYRIDATHRFPGYWAAIPVLATTLIIAAGPSAWFNRTVLSHRLLVSVGLISYPLYMWHWPLLSFARVINGEFPGLAYRIGAVGGSALLAWLTYRLVEKPIRAASFDNSKCIALLVLLAGCGLAGYTAYEKEGLPERFPEEIQLLTQAGNFKWDVHARLNVCHIFSVASAKRSDVCYEKNPFLVALWGDSLAASLYPGLQRLQAERGFGILQLTQAGCGPILNLEKLAPESACNAINANVLHDLQTHQPQLLILHGAWEHKDYPLTAAELYRKLSATLVQARRALPDTRIVIIGPGPRWRDSPQKTSFASWQQSLDKTRMPAVLQPATLLMTTEEVLSKVAREQNVEYLSMIATLCTGTDCISRIGDTPENFIAFDYGHLSKSGAEFVIKRLENALLKAP